MNKETIKFIIGVVMIWSLMLTTLIVSTLQICSQTEQKKIETELKIKELEICGEYKEGK